MPASCFFAVVSGIYRTPISDDCDTRPSAALLTARISWLPPSGPTGMTIFPPGASCSTSAFGSWGACSSPRARQRGGFRCFFGWCRAHRGSDVDDIEGSVLRHALEAVAHGQAGLAPLQELRVAALHVGLRELHQAVDVVDAEGVAAAAADELGEARREVAGAAADVEHLLARGQVRRQPLEGVAVHVRGADGSVEPDALCGAITGQTRKHIGAVGGKRTCGVSSYGPLAQ